MLDFFCLCAISAGSYLTQTFFYGYTFYGIFLYNISDHLPSFC